MSRYLKYVTIGLVLMAPQEAMVALFKGKAFVLYLMALAFWAVLLGAMYGLWSVTSRIFPHEGVAIVVSAVVYIALALFVEWGLIGNSPWGNPEANQLGLLAGWVSVFVLPRAFLEDRFEHVRRWTRIWFCVFVLSLILPVLLLPEKGALVGIFVYGYSVVPFLLLSAWYACAKWPDRPAAPTTGRV